MKRSRQDLILDYLNKGSISSAGLAQTLRCPMASIRRAIGTLRQKGHAITYDDVTGNYSLTRTTAAAVIDTAFTGMDERDLDEQHDDAEASGDFE